MVLFTCTNCGQAIYFENTRCERCGYAIGFVAEEGGAVLRALAGTDEGAFEAAGYSYCSNFQFGVCNWLVPTGSGGSGSGFGGAGAFCKACRLNRMIPNLQEPAFRAYWMLIEVAKHRLVYSLMRLGLPTDGLRFDFVADERDKRVFTGHDNGLITINIAEADDLQREMARQNMNEPYRTLLGHFRHEVGHYYWDLLVRDAGRLGEYRELFGDDSRVYEHALQYHYNQGAPADWTDFYISAYASAHPWEDWAETWAHYMHIMDTFETAYAYGMQVRPRVADQQGGGAPAMAGASQMAAATDFDPYEEKDFGRIIQQWLPLTYALNSINQSMGVGNLYPFIIVPLVMKKLSYIHSVCRAATNNFPTLR
jgi:hypothetical protein